MGYGAGYCCCGCPPLTNTQVIYHSTVVGNPNWHSIRLGISGGPTDPACNSFFSSSVPDLGFLCFWDSSPGGAQKYKRTGRPDGVDITVTTRPGVILTVDGGQTDVYAPKSIRLDKGPRYLDFNYSNSGSPLLGTQTVNITTNCPGPCNWSAAAISTWLCPRYVTPAALTPTMTLGVSGITSPITGLCPIVNPTCLAGNKSYAAGLFSALSFDGYIADATWTLASGSDSAEFSLHALPLPGVCLGPGLPGLSTSIHSNASGYFVQEKLLCADAKDAHSAAWPNRVFGNVDACGACGFCCDVFGLVVTVTE